MDQRSTISRWGWIFFFFLETQLVLAFVLSDYWRLKSGVIRFEILTYSIGELRAQFWKYLCGYFLSISMDLFSRNSLNFFNREMLFSLSFGLVFSLGQKLSGLGMDFLSILGSITIKNYYLSMITQFIKCPNYDIKCPFQQDYFIESKMSSNIMKSLVRIFPNLTAQNFKGQNGRIGVVGGSYEFTGAPFYSAISALKVGGDLGHIFCNKASATPIKTYSPQIIVHPIFVSDEQACLLTEGRKKVPEIWMQKIMAWSNAINIWIVGPGLGRDPNIAHFFPTLVKNLPSQDVIVFNADGIYHLCQHPQLLQQLPRFKKTVLLTNELQWQTLKEYTKLDIPSEEIQKMQTTQEITQITDIFSNPSFTVVLKGRKDIILGRKSFICDLEGGRKRCGGIGDILAGITGVCTFWDEDLGPILASKITKQATKAAFDKHGRSMTAPCIVSQLPMTVMEIERRYKEE